jgi:hypothetical protein
MDHLVLRVLWCCTHCTIAAMQVPWQHTVRLILSNQTHATPPDMLLCLQGRGWQLDRQQGLNSAGCLYCASLC